MKIYSNFRDYYDCVQSHGQDQSVVYLRKKAVSLHSFELPDRIVMGKHFDEEYIGFCGHIHKVWVDGKNVFYDLDSVYEYVVRDLKNKERQLFNEGGKNCRVFDGWRYWRSIKSKAELEKIWSIEPDWVKTFSTAFQDYKCPIFLLRDSDYDERQKEDVHYGGGRWAHLDSPVALETNPRLLPYQFVKIKDPYTAYQDIAQYMSGVLGGVREVIPEVSNDDMIEAKGFHLKESFRKAPSKKK